MKFIKSMKYIAVATAAFSNLMLGSVSPAFALSDVLVTSKTGSYTFSDVIVTSKSAVAKPTATKTQTAPKPTGKVIEFNPIILVDTIAPKKDKDAKLSFHNGIFINDADGGKYTVCGRVKKAQDLEINNRGRAVIEIDGKLNELETIPPATNGDYKFCGDIDVKDLGEVAPEAAQKKATLARFFNNFLINLKNKTGQTATERYTVVNSAERDTQDVIHDSEMEFILNNQGASGDRINDYLSHAVNDFVLSNQDKFEDKAEDAYDKATGGTCNLETIYNNIQDERGFFATVLMQVFETSYDITHDIDGDETMTLCFDSLEVGDSKLSVATGSDIESMFKISGSVKNIKVRLSFKHYSNGYFSGYTPLEEGTLVLNLGTVSTRAYAQNLDMRDGRFTGNLTVDYVSAASIDAYWEDWQTTDVWYETADSGMDALDEKLDEKFASGLYNDEMEDHAIDKEIDNTEMAILFAPDAKLFAMVIEDLEVETPSVISSFYSKQGGYRTTENDGTYTIYQNHEMSFALDDDLVNHQMHLMVKEGKLNITQTQAQDDGSTVTIKFAAPVAPVVSFDGEDEYAMRLDIANATLSMVNSKNPVTMEYRVDISTVLSMFAEGTGKFINFNLEDSDIHMVSVKGPKAPDKLIESAMKTMINQVLSKMEAAVNEKITTKLTQVMSSMPVNLCTDFDDVGGNGSGNYLAGSVDLAWENSIEKDDSCFKIKSTSSSNGSATAYDSDCNPDEDDCSFDETEGEPNYYDTTDSGNYPPTNTYY